MSIHPTNTVPSHLHIFLGALFELASEALKFLLFLLQAHHILVNHCRELNHLGTQQSCVTFLSLPSPPIPLLHQSSTSRLKAVLNVRDQETLNQPLLHNKYTKHNTSVIHLSSKHPQAGGKPLQLCKTM